MTEDNSVTKENPFAALTPDFILDAVESRGFLSDGRAIALNSYENRVLQIGLEDASPLIAKFYRPNRWSKEQILEEHNFCFELVEQELPVVAPMVTEGESLFEYQGYYCALFERKGGHAPELDNPDNLFTLGRFLGRIHRVGQAKGYQHRPSLTPQSYGHDSINYIIEHALPDEVRTAYETLARDLMQLVDELWQRAGQQRYIRVHGDSHVGNILWRDDNPHFVDLDDSRMAPAIQDLWMLLSGEKDQQQKQLLEIIEGYQEFCDFNVSELQLIECLRTLRMIYHSAWLARRWHDPAFKLAFPYFGTVQYWQEQILDLRMQFAELQEPPVSLPNY